MTFELLVDPGFLRELAGLPADDQETVKKGLRGFLGSPLEHPGARLLRGSSYRGSFRLRIGPFRVLGIVAESQDLILLTTVFRKKRETDYDGALVRHERRLAAQGPSIGDFFKDARRRKQR